MTPDELAERFRRMPFAEKREQLMSKIVLIAERNAKKRTPVRFGTLKRSITSRVEPGGLRGFIGTNVEYAPFVHEGTRFMQARPFLQQGIEDSRAEINKALQEAGDQYLGDVVK